MEAAGKDTRVKVLQEKTLEARSRARIPAIRMPKIRGACPKPPQLNAPAVTASPRTSQKREHGGATVVAAPWLSAAEVRAKHVQKRDTSITGRPGGAGAEMPGADPPPYIIAVRTF